MENNPLDNLPPETRQRVENALQALGGGISPQNVFVTQYPGKTLDNMPQGQFPESVLEAFSQFTNVSSQPQKQTGPDQAWVHWQYDPEEWALFDKVDWEPVRKKSRLALILGPILYLVIIGVLLAVVWIASHSFMIVIVAVLAPAIILLTALMFLIISAASSLRAAKKRYQARQNQTEPHRVTFSAGGIWESGTYIPLNSGLLELKSVKMTTNPAVLCFKMLIRNQDGSWTGTNQKVQVLVPRDCETQAEQLRQRYDAEVIYTKGKYNNHPEPI